MSRIVLACGASAALHKAVDLASKLAQAGHAVRAVLTPRAAELVSPQLFEAVSGEPAFVNEFGGARRAAMDHIELARWCELFLVAPASADLVARLAHGLADDLVTTVALALAPKTPRLLCPAMNPNMLAAPAVARNLERLALDGWQLLSSAEGHLACGDAGRGRLPEPEAIVLAVAALLPRTT
jgi:phosphopantothenoylcysteine decarboxylase/phosphopantothenate--cysteine ligase